MVEKTIEEPRKERFEFIFSVNGNIICQRYFRINGFNERSLGSVQLMEALWDCQRAIHKDLIEKSKIYLELTSPQIFKDKEEMAKWVEKQPFKLDHPSFVILRDCEDVFVWDGSVMKPYDKQFNRWDYLGESNDTTTVLKLAFLDNGEEIRSISWNGNEYPRFVRTNIDISNSKNKYESEANFSPYEAAIVNEFIKDRDDIIPYIMRTLTYACVGTENRKYFSKIRYGEKEYDINLNGYNERLFLTMKKRGTAEA